MKLFLSKEGNREQARQLTEELGAVLFMAEETADNDAETLEELHLRLDADGLSLVDGDLSMRGDFAKLLPRVIKGRLAGEMLVKAAKRKNFGERSVLIDATAGMGEDSFLLAAAGFEVHMYEYDPIIAALLEDTLKRAMEDPELCDIAGRMKLYKEDSIRALSGREEKVDVVLLDPMFPERQKSALIKKKFQLLQQLERPCSDEEELFRAAMEAGPKKIIIKRPLKGPFLAGRKPDYSLTGKAIRYDCIVLARAESESAEG